MKQKKISKRAGLGRVECARARVVYTKCIYVYMSMYLYTSSRDISSLVPVWLMRKEKERNEIKRISYD
jgi:hypothetical protein